MSQAVMEPGVSASAKENLENYARTHDPKYVTEDAVFVNLNSGEETRGRQAIGEMLHYMYHVAFDARAEVTNTMIAGDKAMLEGYFKGKHMGEFAGMPASHKEVNVPLCVTYDMEKGLIKKARIYMLESVMMKQLTQ